MKWGAFWKGIVSILAATVWVSGELPQEAAGQDLVAPDLAVAEFSLGGSEEVKLGEEIGDRLSLTVINQGQAAAEGDIFVGLVVSADETIDSSDTLLSGGREAFTGLAAGATTTVDIASVTSMIADFATGPAYLGVIVDEQDSVSETNEGNNTASIPVSIVAEAQGEDCITFDPALATVEQINGTWRITAGNSILLSFGSKEQEARRALEIIKAYGMTQQCFVGRPNPSMEYYLVDGESPTGSIEGEDCLPFDPDKLEVKQINGRWKIVEGASILLDFGENEAEARQSLEIILTHEFNRMCFVGRPDPSMTYFKQVTESQGLVIGELAQSSGVAGDVINIAGQNFGTDADDLCVLLRNNGRFIGLEALTATGTEITAELPYIPEFAAGAEHELVVGLGVGARQEIGGNIENVGVGQPAWIWAGDKENMAVADAAFVPEFSPSPGSSFHSGGPQNGALMVTIDQDWGVGTTVDIQARVHQEGTGADTRIKEVTFSAAGTRFDCAAKICQLLEEAFASHPDRPLDIECEVRQQDGNAKIVVTLAEEGAVINGGNIDIIVRDEGEPVSPDLAVGDFGLEGEPRVEAGGSVGDRINLSVSNLGGLSVAQSFSVGLYFSEDSNITADDTLLINGQEMLAGLEVGGSTEVTVFGDAQMPGELSAGQGYLGVLVDDTAVIEEQQEGNNQASLPVTVEAAPSVEPKLNISLSSENEITLMWEGAGVLQKADEITGPWSEVSNAESPLTVTLEGNRIFYRLVRPSVTEQTMPIFKVTQQGISDRQFSALAESLGVPKSAFGESGYVQYTDTERFQSVPTEPVEEPLEPDEEEQAKVVPERFLFDQIQEISILDNESALGLTKEAFSQAELTPKAPYKVQTDIRHSEFEAVDAKGEVLVNKPIDTQVAYQLQLDGHPVVGSGAQIKAVFDGQKNVSHLAYILRQVEKGKSVPVLSQSEADAKAEAQYGASMKTDLQGELKLSSKLVYYAPSIEHEEVGVLIPHYQYEGTFMPQGAEQPVQLRRLLLPAVQQETGLKPDAGFEANVEEGTIVAEASVEGGTKPYTLEWQSSTTVVNSGGDDVVQYQIGPVKASPVQETLTLTVTDANGIQTHASQTFEVESDQVIKSGDMARQGFRPLVGGVVDAGTEWIGESQGLSGSSGNAGGFASRFASHGATTLRFNWGDASAWERDFKDPSQGGNDSVWIDNVDVAFYTGHANANGWTFPGSKDDGFLHYNEARFGNNDLEWLTVAACGPLQPGNSPNRWWQRWGPAFKGLHLLCGYQTVTYDNTVEGKKWARKMLNGKPVRQAWMETGIDVQGPSEIVAVMGVFGPNGVSNWNDHYHGKGSVGPDISNVNGYWMVSSPGD